MIMNGQSTAIEFQGAGFRLPDGRALLTGLDLSIARGETLVLLGRSGSGKTTTLKLINRLLDPTEGRVLVDGKPTTAWDPIRLRRRIGYVIQEVGLFPHFTIEENVAVVPRLEGWEAERIHNRVRELLDLVGLDPARFAGRYPRELSGGQRQRVGVARALAARRRAPPRRGPADHASRRAFRRARSHHEARDTGGIPLAAAPARQNDGLRHARRRRGVAARLAHRAAEGRPRRAARAPRGFSGVARSRGRGVRFVPPRRRRGCRRAMNLWQFLAAHRAEVVQLSLEHLFLVAVSTGIAILIGVPLGVALTRRPALSKPILGFANIMQTVPSLALFGFLIPLNIYLFHVRIIGGIGARTAIASLALYALLPIIRNTFTGINGVDPAIREAGRGLGMTDRQLLLQVEVPRALGVIVAGIRVATVIAVGPAITVATRM